MDKKYILKIKEVHFVIKNIISFKNKNPTYESILVSNGE